MRADRWLWERCQESRHQPWSFQLLGCGSSAAVGFSFLFFSSSPFVLDGPLKCWIPPVSSNVCRQRSGLGCSGIGRAKSQNPCNFSFHHPFFCFCNLSADEWHRKWVIFSVYGSDVVTFKFFNLNLSGVGMRCSSFDVTVGPNLSYGNGDPPLTSTACFPFQIMFASVMSQRGTVMPMKSCLYMTSQTKFYYITIFL